jgi:hypothetical protein
MSISSPTQLRASWAGYEPKIADGEELEGLFRFRRPDESEEESCVELSGEADDTAERGWSWGSGLGSCLANMAVGDPKLI